MTWDKWKLKPETAKEIQEVETIRGKRQRLTRYSYEHPLVRAIFHSAHAQGLSGEDTMTWLAYEALLRVEQLEGLLLDDAMIRAPKYVVFPNGDVGKLQDNAKSN